MAKAVVQSLERLQMMVSEIEKFHTTVFVEIGDQVKEIKVTSNTRATYTCIQLLDPGIDRYEHIASETLSEAFNKIPELAPGATVHLETMQINIAIEKFSQDWIEIQHSDKKELIPSTSISKNDLYSATLNAWSDVFQVTIPEESCNIDSNANRTKLIRNALMPFLLAGAVGIKNFNDQPRQTVALADLTLCELANQNLDTLHASGLDMSNSNFDGASLEDAVFFETRLDGATFRGAKLRGAKFRNAQARRADFEGANLTGAELPSGCFSSSSFRNADLSKCVFYSADLCGADLTNAKITGTKFDYAEYDEHTKFPKGFVQTSVLRWAGDGPDPFDTFITTVSAANFDEFLEILKANFDKSRLDTVAKMLKKEKFELYTDVEKGLVIGIVKSQTNPDLIYSCMLDADGVFSCCTQNLRPCGGLKGVLCKHILLLIVGLTKNHRMTPTDSVRWVMKSLRMSPELDKNENAEIFLKYKASQSGEIDWRPTETIPEDYYSF